MKIFNKIVTYVIGVFDFEEVWNILTNILRAMNILKILTNKKQETPVLNSRSIKIFQFVLLQILKVSLFHI